MNTLLRLASAIFITALIQLSASGQERSYTKYCDLEGFESSLRETNVVIDSGIITPEQDDILEENKIWRQRVSSLLNGAEPGALRRWAPRERVTVSIVDGDTGGLRNIFEGCMPLYTAEEEKKLESEQSGFGAFLGGGWKRNLKNDQDDFRRALAFSLAVGARNSSQASSGEPFTSSSLGQALARGYNPSQQYGVPRLIILTDSEVFDFPEGDAESVMIQAREDGVDWSADLSRSEVHILGASSSMTSPEKDYIRHLFLSAKGEVQTITSLNGSLNSISAPIDISVYRGAITYPDGKYPMTVRLAIDPNGRAVNSWVEVQSDQVRFAPLEGVLTCANENECEFSETGNFAQVWTVRPGGEPEFENWMPFVGFRDITLVTDGDKATGKIFDSSGYVEELPDGLPFELEKRESDTF